MCSDINICVIQVLTVSSSVPPKVSEALSTAADAGCSLVDLLQREQFISNMLNQVGLVGYSLAMRRAVTIHQLTIQFVSLFLTHCSINIQYNMFF